MFLQGLLRTKCQKKRGGGRKLFFAGYKQGGWRWRGTRPFLGSSDLSPEDRDKGRREECTDGSLFRLAQHSCTAEVKGNCFKIPFAKSAVCFSANSCPWDANCKPEGLVFNTHLFWRVSALSKGPRAVAGLWGLAPVREWGKGCAPGKCTAAAGEKVRTKGCTWRGWCRAVSGLGNFTKAMKCGMELVHTLPATISDVQYSFLTAFHFFVANN